MRLTGPHHNHQIARNAQMAVQFRDGKTLQEIGDQYDVTRERVRQILTRLGVGRLDGGGAKKSLVRAVSSIAAKQQAKAARVQKTERRFGCTVEILIAINGDLFVWTDMQKRPFTKAARYIQQMRNARRRGVAWEFTFCSWWEIWDRSGKWGERGPGKGYCMGRFGDSGPYGPDNVYICTVGQNFSDSYLTKPWNERFAGTHKVRKAHCLRGHERSPENVRGNGNCRICEKQFKKARRLKLAA